MNSQEAITLLRNLEDALDSYCELNEEGKTAFRMAITALNCSEIPNSWILCSERMPNENDYNSCMECIDGAVWYFTENGAMGLGYYYESTKEWATTDDLSTDGKVVAWQPLPEPYRGD